MADNRAPVRRSAVADAAGGATVTFTARGAAVIEWRQFGITMPNSGAAQGQMFFNGAPVTPFFLPTDAISQPPYQQTGASDEITLVVTGATPGSILTVAGFWVNV
jgi:hypothetical protein